MNSATGDWNGDTRVPPGQQRCDTAAPARRSWSVLRSTIPWLAPLVAACLVCKAGVADDSPPAALPNKEDQHAFEEMLRQTEALGPWDRQAALNAEATDLFFDRQGWTSEPDRFARSVLRDVDRIPPWRQQERMNVFTSALQQRYQLSEHQKQLVGRGFEAETWKLTTAHFRRMAPIAMEALGTRAAGKPFTAEQVARWSQNLRPVLDDGRAAIERVAQRLSDTMSPEQRKLLTRDVEAFVRRHQDVQKAVERWARGEWDPTQWGLDNDPAHAALVAEKRAKDAAREALRQRPPAETGAAAARPDDESTWERYVREFCAANGLDAVQTKSARAILADLVARAKDLRRARAEQIAALERSLAAETDPSRRQARQTELSELLAPISEMFDELKARLDDLLTAEQRGRMAPAPASSARSRPPG